MDQPFYSVSQFAQKASVSVRTLRYYDKEGLLSPSHYSESGYRLYTDADLVNLQYILALKYLGFSLEEIKACLQTGPKQLQEMLVQQKAMMQGKRLHLDAIIRAIEETEKLLQTDHDDFDSITKIIQVMQMELKPEWVYQYLTHEQRLTMRDLAKTSYSEEALQKLTATGWTEEDHQRHVQDYGYFRTELKRLVTAGADPASPEAQALARFLTDMNNRRSQGNPEILAGMKKSWENFNTLPDEKKPAAYVVPEEEREFIKKACIMMYQKKQSGEV